MGVLKEKEERAVLHIIYGEIENCIENTSVYFKNVYEPDWITSDIAREIIKDIDKSEVKSGYCIESPVFGQIPPEKLSGGTKTLILMDNEPDKIFNASSTCGDNCAKWILKIAEKKDITINLLHFMNFGDKEFIAKVLNCNKVAHNMRELLPMASEYLNG